MVAYTLSVAAAVGGVLGAIPSIASVPANLATILRTEGRAGTSGRGVRAMRRALIMTQVAIAFVLLIGAGLLLASFRHVLAIDPGFTSEGIWTATINLPPSRYAEDRAIGRFTDEALRAVRSVPGVVAAGTTTAIPFGDDFDEDVIFPEGHRLNPGDSLIAPYSGVTTGRDALVHRDRRGRRSQAQGIGGRRWRDRRLLGLALFLAAIGIYGVLAYLVTLRTREIGIRVALGSSSRAVFHLILGEGLVLIAAGFALGAAGAIAFRRTLQSELVGVRASDPGVLATVVGVLAIVALAACAIPARRATRIDPIVALAE